MEKPTKEELKALIALYGNACCDGEWAQALQLMEDMEKLLDALFAEVPTDAG